MKRTFKTPTRYQPAVKYGTPSLSTCKPGAADGGAGLENLLSCGLDRDGEEGGEQADNDWSVSVQQQPTSTSVQGSLRPEQVISVNTS